MDKRQKTEDSGEEIQEDILKELKPDGVINCKDEVLGPSGPPEWKGISWWFR